MHPHELITGDDNHTLEPAYVWWGVAIVVGLGLEIYSVVTGKAFDLQAYGIGIGALMIAAGYSKKVGS